MLAVQTGAPSSVDIAKTFGRRDPPRLGGGRYRAIQKDLYEPP